LPAILCAGLTCGVMDITAAFITWRIKGVQPARVIRGIAAGLLGPKSFQMGAPTAALGLAIHFFVAFSATTVFYLASRRIAFMTQQPVIAGILYGFCVYVVMYWGVIPHSASHRAPLTLTAHIVAILTHFVCVGLPISLVIHHFSK
ncbi:MAG TPA: hypothetical protein VLV89_13785, partial [Candidatus Acidoferrum sp.]|nr:hypothetical protein [Candidatus Acidoferrum sp.]